MKKSPPTVAVPICATGAVFLSLAPLDVVAEVTRIPRRNCSTRFDRRSHAERFGVRILSRESLTASAYSVVGLDCPARMRVARRSAWRVLKLMYAMPEYLR